MTDSNDRISQLIEDWVRAETGEQAKQRFQLRIRVRTPSALAAAREPRLTAEGR